MHYTFYFKQQARLYILYVLSAAITYAIMRYFGWREVIVVTPGHIACFASATFTYVFLGPLYLVWFDSLKK